MAYSSATEEHLVRYDDGDSKWHDLLLEERMGTLTFINSPRVRTHGAYDDTVPHYICYNADTRALNMYPNVSVLEEADVLDTAAFVQQLAGPPHYLYVPPNPEWVRKCL